MRPQGSRPIPNIVWLLTALVVGVLGLIIGVFARNSVLLIALVATLVIVAIAAAISQSRASRSLVPPTVIAVRRGAPPVLVVPPAAVVPIATPPAAVDAVAAPVVVAAPSVTKILPAPSPFFIGREQELDHLVAALRRSHGNAAIAVVGPAGAGKHTLIMRAIEAHIESGTFTDGYSWHASTDYHGDIGMRRLLIDVLDRFGGPAVAMTTTLRMGEAAVADLVRGKRILFWLDDIPNDFPIGRALSALTARDAAGVGPTLILSSREDWAIPEITEIALDVPQLDESLDLLREWMDIGGRTTDSNDYDAIKAICVNLTSLPLALRLAAGYATQSGVKLPKLAADLGSAVYPPGDPTRTASGTITFVEQALFPQPRRSFAALAVFETPVFDLDAACAVAAAVSGGTIDTVQSDLESMVRLGLLEPDGDEEHPHLRMHPAVRQYAVARLAALGSETTATARATLATILHARRTAKSPSDSDVFIWGTNQNPANAVDAH